jgi:anthranilate/para-aminobenzoate synthase component I
MDEQSRNTLRENTSDMCLTARKATAQLFLAPSISFLIVPSPVIIERLAWPKPLTPERVLSAWPAHRALAALWSGSVDGARRSPWARWTILAGVTETRTVSAAAAEQHEASPERSPSLTAIDEWAGSTRLSPADIAALGDDAPPFIGGWIGAISYEVGREVEPAARVHPLRTDTDAAWPRVLWQRCPAAYVHDHHTGTWFRVARSSDGGASDPFACLPSEHDLIHPAQGVGATGTPFTLELHPQTPTDRARYIASAQRLIDYIYAGDLFQANLAHQLRAEFSGSSRALARAMLHRAAPWYGAYLEDDSDPDTRRAIVSVSPELILHVDPRTRTITTRPIKGTRPARTDPRELSASAKDRAELAMIIDLMRNDLGRICEFGTVRVDEHHTIEHHGGSSSEHLTRSGVHHGVATITGRIRNHISIADILHATFPGGSITGAPKVRAMQIIEELEPESRGPYTGAIGCISDSGHIAFNIAIRTACIQGRRAAQPDQLIDGSLRFGVGAGIVADSDPEQEWRETLDKARVLTDLVDEQTPTSGSPSHIRVPSTSVAPILESRT